MQQQHADMLLEKQKENEELQMEVTDSFSVKMNDVDQKRQIKMLERQLNNALNDSKRFENDLHSKINIINDNNELIAKLGNDEKQREKIENNIQESSKQIETENKRLRDENDALQNKYDVIKCALTTLKEDNDKQTTSTKQMTVKLNQLTDELKILYEENTIYKERITNCTIQILSLQNANAAHKETHKALRNKIETQAEKHEDREKYSAQAMIKINNERKRLKSQNNDYEDAINNITAVLEDANETKAKLNDALQKQAADIVDLKKQKEETQLNYTKLLVERAKNKIFNDWKQLTKKYQLESEQNKGILSRLNEHISRLQTEKNGLSNKYIIAVREQTRLSEENEKIKMNDDFKQENEQKKVTESNERYIDQIKDLNLQINEMRQENKRSALVINPINLKLNDSVDFIAAPCDILYDEDESDDEKTEEVDNVLLSDDELCKILQHDLENYNVDQRKNEKNREKREENKHGKKKKKKKNMLILNELRIFHENKAQTVRHWDSSLKKNHFSTLFETLEEKLDDKYTDNDDDDIDSEKIVYNILFDLIIESYDVLHSEYTKIIQKEYQSPNVIDMVLMNISVFYDLMKREKIKTLKKRIANIHKYINDIINGIYKQTKSKHMYVDDEDRNELCQFIVNCCELIWSVLHYDFTVYPLNFILSKSDRKYNDKIHEKEGVSEGDKIEYCIFPAIMKENKHMTKIWVICDELYDKI